VDHEFDNDYSQSVLVVDDDRTMRKLVRCNLETEGFLIEEAADGFNCLSALHDKQIDLILLDVGLPDFNGWGILGLIRMTASLSHMPVILCTAEEPDRALAAQFKPDDYIQKPFDISDLLGRVKAVMRSRCSDRRGADKTTVLAP
jgi:DNA-binding response OmpR family regulator